METNKIMTGIIITGLLIISMGIGINIGADIQAKQDTIKLIELMNNSAYTNATLYDGVNYYTVQYKVFPVLYLVK